MKMVRVMAGEALELAMAERMDRGEEIPAASAAKPGDILVRLRPLLAAKGWFGPRGPCAAVIAKKMCFHPLTRLEKPFHGADY